MGKMRNAYRILVGKPEGMRPFGRPRHEWEDESRIDLREVGWECVDWLHLALSALVYTSITEFN
jgi:hypothetical protein